MALDIVQFPCLQDNYGFLVRDPDSGEVACIDTPDASAIMRELERHGWHLSIILNTHWHPDHAGGNEALRQATNCRIVAPAEVAARGPVDRVVGDGDHVALGRVRFDVLEVGGHTLGHIAYHAAGESVAFVGDVMFPLGCGRIFEGDPRQMLSSLERIAALPPETRIYSAHEYTAANARFALSVDRSQALRERSDAIFAARARGEPTVPTTIAIERATNPFLRARLLAPNAESDVAAFAALRRAKDVFKG